MNTNDFTAAAEQALHEAWAGSAEQRRAEAEAARMWPEDLHLGAHDGIIPTGQAERMLLIQRQAYELGEKKAWIRAQQEPTDAEVDAAALEEGTLTVLRESGLPLDQYDVVREHLERTRDTKPEAWAEGREMARRILTAARAARRADA